MVTLSKKDPRWGYRFIHQLLCGEDWTVNRKRVQRVRRQEGLRVRAVNKRKRRPRASMGYPVQATYPGHVWSWDLMMDRTTDGRSVKRSTGVYLFGQWLGIYRPDYSGWVFYRRRANAVHRPGQSLAEWIY
ncbi:MAG: IS3 family transposase [Gemmatimonadetes bacterium]|nr:IS3 family transposase [Gemmatimonadota bacterium]